ncbi:serine/threonine protein kinase [Nocardioides sp. TF02-7]|nr:serine/threonine protein kinase [Nocardioides sp. TF02-7]
MLGRVVAMKRVGLPVGTSSFDLARAEREARLAARVNHPNVIAVYDFFADEDEHWLVMEHVDGTTLARMIADRGALSPDEVATVLAQTAEALAAAHELGIVHRDVKPSNILVGADGDVKLSDFGIARAVADVSLTQTGLVTGSPAYLSPEVATGSGGTPASDVWSFGATMFHALAGRPPYQVDGGGSAVLGVLYRIAHEPPPRLRTAGWLGPLLEMTMTHDPAQRPSMEDVASYLRARIDHGSAPLPEATAVLPPVGPEPVGPEPAGQATAFLPPTPPAAASSGRPGRDLSAATGGGADRVALPHRPRRPPRGRGRGGSRAAGRLHAVRRRRHPPGRRRPAGRPRAEPLRRRSGQHRGRPHRPEPQRVRERGRRADGGGAGAVRGGLRGDGRQRPRGGVRDADLRLPGGEHRVRGVLGADDQPADHRRLRGPGRDDRDLHLSLPVPGPRQRDRAGDPVPGPRRR